MVSETTVNNPPAESPHTNSLPLTFGELEEPSRPTSAPHRDGGDSVAPVIHDMSLGRFYCEEYDCGGVFLSKAHLESHMIFFHPEEVGGDLFSWRNKC